MATKTSPHEQDQIPDWMQPIKKKLGELSERPLQLSIFKVPDKLRKENEDAYSPRIVSIGPFHSSRSLLQQTWANKDNHQHAEEDDKWRHTEEDDKWRHMLSLEEVWRHMLSLVQQTLVKKHDHLTAMEEHKWWYTLYLFQNRTQNPMETLKRCGAVLVDLDKRVRGSYAENINFHPHDLSEIMLIDGCFILELLFRSWLHDQEEGDGDPIPHNDWMVSALQQDLALLENQIPFFVLQELYNIVRHLLKPEYDGSIPSSITELAVHFFYPDLKSNNEAIFREKCSEAGKDCKHLLDLLHKFHLPTYPEADPQAKKESESKSSQEAIREECMSTSLEIGPEGKEDLELNQEAIKENCSTSLKMVEPEGHESCSTSVKMVKPEGQESSSTSPKMDKQEDREYWGFEKCATTLSEAGIKFAKGTNVSLLGIEFHKGVIEIPPLSFDEKTESLLGNLIAFEQCCPGSKHHVQSYIVLLKTLLRSIQDIELLKQKEIITPNWVGDENVLNFFNNTLREIKPKDFCFSDLCKDVKEDEKSWWHWHRIEAVCKVRSRTYWKVLKRDYFATPWSFISFIAALLLLVLTFVQTYYSVRSYLDPDADRVGLMAQDFMDQMDWKREPNPKRGWSLGGAVLE